MNVLQKSPLQAVSGSPDPITLEIVRGALRSAQLEMGSLLACRTVPCPAAGPGPLALLGCPASGARLWIGSVTGGVVRQ